MRYKCAGDTVSWIAYEDVVGDFLEGYENVIHISGPTDVHVYKEERKLDPPVLTNNN